MATDGEWYPNCRKAGATKKNFKPADAKHRDAWIEDMILWGKRVRKDIMALEKACGVAKGDPGDPPPPE